jgi:hypothetical protein
MPPSVMLENEVKENKKNRYPIDLFSNPKPKTVP